MTPRRSQLTLAAGVRRLDSHRHRAVRRASELWAVGQYHRAIEALDDAGMTRAEIDEFIRAGHRVARERTVRLLNR